MALVYCIGILLRPNHDLTFNLVYSQYGRIRTGHESFLTLRTSNAEIMYLIKFIYSVKATKFREIFTLLLPYVVPVKISHNFVAFSKYMNFTK